MVVLIKWVYNWHHTSLYLSAKNFGDALNNSHLQPENIYTSLPMNFPIFIFWVLHLSMYSHSYFFVSVRNEHMAPYFGFVLDRKHRVLILSARRYFFSFNFLMKPSEITKILNIIDFFPLSMAQRVNERQYRWQFWYCVSWKNQQGSHKERSFHRIKGIWSFSISENSKRTQFAIKYYFTSLCYLCL